MKKVKKFYVINREVFSWCLYDFAVSSYSAVIIAVIFPVYYANYIVVNDEGLGDLWWGRAISLSMALVALISPVVGGIADYSGIRKRMLAFFTYLAAGSVFLFTLLEKGDILTGFFLIVIANISIEAGFVFYNAFLPIIAPAQHYGRVSSWGYGIGYMGSVLSLITALLITKHFHIDWVWVSVSLFLIMFSMPAFLMLPEDQRKESFFKSAKKGVLLIFSSLKKIVQDKGLRRFLLGYFFYADGVNTVIVFSSIYASNSLGFNTNDLIVLFIMVQITALIGSFGFARLIDTKGPKLIILLSLSFWILVTFLAYLADSKTIFYIIAFMAGLGLGVIQASSRAFFAYFIPNNYENEYFGVYSMVGKSSSVLGPLIFGEISRASGSQRLSILSISLLFTLGIIIIAPLNRPKKEIINNSDTI